MKITRRIDGIGTSMMIPIHDNDQVAGISIAGEYDGLLQIVGMIDVDGREQEVVVRDSEGNIVDINDPTPLDVFVDNLGGFAFLKIIVAQWNSGSLNISSVTSAAHRKRAGSGGNVPSTVVEVSNFPDVQPVTGPLTNGQLRSFPVDVDVKEMPANVAQDASLIQINNQLVGYDSLGDPLPILFNFVASQFFYDVNEIVEREVRIVSGETFTRSYVNNGSVITDISPWVRT